MFTRRPRAYAATIPRLPAWRARGVPRGADASGLAKLRPADPIAGAADGKWQISTEGGAQPLGRADASELLSVSTGGRVMAVPITRRPAFTPGKPHVLFTASMGGAYIARKQYAVSPDGKRFLVNLRVDEDPSLTVLQNWIGTRR